MCVREEGFEAECQVTGQAIGSKMRPTRAQAERLPTTTGSREAGERSWEAPFAALSVQKTLPRWPLDLVSSLKLGVAR